ncbi:MAG: hypothetical protein LUC40_03200, partial [Oscillospiraceae bacterium]|nr:hypothetical protein [Oscillospiraceae bacterium]
SIRIFLCAINLSIVPLIAWTISGDFLHSDLVLRSVLIFFVGEMIFSAAVIVAVFLRGIWRRTLAVPQDAARRRVLKQAAI